MIIKVQKSIASFPPDEVALLFTNQHRTFECIAPINFESEKLLKGRHTAYFESSILNGQVVIRNETPNPGW